MTNKQGRSSGAQRIQFSVVSSQCWLRCPHRPRSLMSSPSAQRLVDHRVTKITRHLSIAAALFQACKDSEQLMQVSLPRQRQIGGQRRALQAEVHASKLEDPLERANQRCAARGISRLQSRGCIDFRMARCPEWRFCLPWWIPTHIILLGQALFHVLNGCLNALTGA